MLTPNADATVPNARGFDHSFGHMGGRTDNYPHFFYWAGPNTHDLHRDGVEVFENGKHFPGLMLEDATRFMRDAKDRPFSIHDGLNNPRYLYQGQAKNLKEDVGEWTNLIDQHPDIVLRLAKYHEDVLKQ